MIARTLHRATMLDSVCPEKEILTAIVAGLLHSYPCGGGQKPEVCQWTLSRTRESSKHGNCPAESQIPTPSSD